MSLTLDDYAQAVTTFVEALRPIHSHIEALYLFGSFARGEAIPGYSDLDFWLFFKPAVYKNEATFAESLEHLCQAMRAVQATGIPLYNACCYESAAAVHTMPAMLAANLSQERESRLLIGNDIRPQMQASPASQTANRAAAFFEMRRQLYLPLTALLPHAQMDPKQQFFVFQSLQYLKYVPESACAALDLWPGENAARTTLQSLLPQLDFTPLDSVRQFCIEHGPTAEWTLMKQQIKLALTFVESINDHLLTRLNG